MLHFYFIKYVVVFINYFIVVIDIYVYINILLSYPCKFFLSNPDKPLIMTDFPLTVCFIVLQTWFH